MSEQPVLSFPLSFHIRVVGRNSDDFPSQVVELVRRHLTQIEADHYTLRPSRDGNYISVALPVYFESRDQYEAVYRELNAHEAVIMVL